MAEGASPAARATSPIGIPDCMARPRSRMLDLKCTLTRMLGPSQAQPEAVTMKSSLLPATLCCALAAVPVLAAAASTPLSAALSDPARPAQEVQLGALRKPAEVIAFAGVKSGDRVADFMSGNGYFTRIFSRIVGPSGRVYAFIPAQQLANCSASETVGTKALAHDARYRNVEVLIDAADRFRGPGPV